MPVMYKYRIIRNLQLKPRHHYKMLIWMLLLLSLGLALGGRKGPMPPVGEYLEDIISMESLRSIEADIDRLSSASLYNLGHKSRVAGSAGHEQTIQYVVNTLNEMLNYYYYRFHDFSVETPKLLGFSLSVAGRVAKSAYPVLRSPSAPRLAITMSLVAGSGCRAENYVIASRNRGVFLVEDGNCTVSAKASLAKAAGAKALIVYSSDLNGEPSKVQLDLKGDFAPTFMVSNAEGLEWKDAINRKGPIKAAFHIENSYVQTRVRSIIAETRNGDHDSVIMLGAKTNSPGSWSEALDYTAGLASSLLIARLLAKYEVKNAVRFAWWAVDGPNLSGANNYFQQLSIKENAAIRGYISLDSLRVPTFPSIRDTDQIDLIGTGNLIEKFAAFFKQRFHFYRERAVDRQNDYEGVLLQNIPACGFISPTAYTSSIQQDLPQRQSNTEAQDKMWLFATQATANVLGHYAKSFDCFPKRLRLLIDRPVLVHGCAA